MITLTERLRELETRHANTFCPPFNAELALAQELHALLVECGEALGAAYSKLSDHDTEIDAVLTKLQQAGIV